MFMQIRRSALKNTAILLVQCPDRKGLDAEIADFIFRHGGNILHFEQHQAGEERFYLARVEWDLAGFQLDLTDFAGRFNPVAEKFGMHWRVARVSHRDVLEDLVEKGRDMERVALSRAVRWHIENRILLY